MPLRYAVVSHKSASSFGHHGYPIYNSSSSIHESNAEYGNDTVHIEEGAWLL